MASHVVIVDPAFLDKFERGTYREVCHAWCATCGWDATNDSPVHRSVYFAGWMHYEETGFGSVVVDERHWAMTTSTNWVPETPEPDPYEPFIGTYTCHGCGYEHADTTPECDPPYFFRTERKKDRGFIARLLGRIIA